MSGDDLAELRRHAEDVAATTALTIEVTEADYRIDGRRQYGYYNVMIPGVMAAGLLSFDRAWGEINGIESGVDAVRAAQDRHSPIVEYPADNAVMWRRGDKPVSKGEDPRPSVLARLLGRGAGAR